MLIITHLYFRYLNPNDAIYERENGDEQKRILLKARAEKGNTCAAIETSNNEVAGISCVMQSNGLFSFTGVVYIRLY